MQRKLTVQIQNVIDGSKFLKQHNALIAKGHYLKIRKFTIEKCF
jgi:hypothetical protein